MFDCYRNYNVVPEMYLPFILFVIGQLNFSVFCCWLEDNVYDPYKSLETSKNPVTNWNCQTSSLDSSYCICSTVLQLKVFCNCQYNMLSLRRRKPFSEFKTVLLTGSVNWQNVKTRLMSKERWQKTMMKNEKKTLDESVILCQ